MEPFMLLLQGFVDGVLNWTRHAHPICLRKLSRPAKPRYRRAPHPSSKSRVHFMWVDSQLIAISKLSWSTPRLLIADSRRVSLRESGVRQSNALSSKLLPVGISTATISTLMQLKQETDKPNHCTGV